MVIETRASAKKLEIAPEGTSSTEREDQPSAPSGPLAMSATAPPATSRPASTTTSRSSATVVARRLAAEAHYARRLAELEAQKTRAQALQTDLERDAAEAELRAELAAIDADTSRRGSAFSSRSTVQDWVNVNAVPNVDQTLIHDSIYRHAAVEAAQVEGHTSATVPARELRKQAAEFTAPRQERTATDVPQLIQSLEVLIGNVNKGVRPNKISLLLPHFDGKSHLDWLSFKRIYDDTERSYSTVENLARLGAALHGAAREAVAALLVSAREPGAVLRALGTRFGRPELVVLREVAAVRALPRVSSEGKDFAIFACRVRNCVEVVRLLNQSDYLRSPELFQALISKISPLLRTRWLEYAALHDEIGTSKLELFADYLEHEVDLQSRYGVIFEPSAVPTMSHAIDNRRPKDKVHAVVEGRRANKHASTTKSQHSTTASSDIFCILCNQSHSLSDCQNFKSMSVSDRWQCVKKKRVCHRCLKVGWHRLIFCKAKSQCGVDGCTFRHHVLLHDPSYERAAAAHVEVEDDDEPSTSAGERRAECDAATHDAEPQLKEVLTHASTSSPSSSLSSSQQSSSRPLLKVVAVTVTGPSGSVDTFALLDDGSTATFVDAEIAAKLGVDGPEKKIYLDCVGGLSKETLVRYIDFHIKGRNSNETHLIRNARAIAGLGAAGQFVKKQYVCKYPYLSDIADEFCYGDVKPTIIIGIDNWHLSVSRATRKGTKTQPVAIQTSLGWVLFGFGCSSTAPVDFVCHTTLHDSEVGQSSGRSVLEHLIREQYKLDSLGISKHEARNADDERAMEVTERTARRLPDGRFEVGLIWKSDKLLVPDNYKLALSRFLGLERKMNKDACYAQRYRQNIHDMLQKGYAELCTEVCNAKSPVWYLPHFGVVNPNKPQKLRVVHDAAAGSHGVSLNSLLLTGPDLLQSLFDILLRFREGKVALTADIREMFPQFKIIERDRDAQRFLWRDSTHEPIRTYRMSSMIFGAASSPFTALYLKNRNAEEWQARYPDAARAIIADHYMDDFIGSLDSAVHAAQLAADIYTVHRKAGLEMRGWVSNSLSALSKLPKDCLMQSPSADQGLNVDLGHLSVSVRTLRLIWQPLNDSISFNTGIKKEIVLPDKLTKRTVLAYVMRIYDPLGILAPIVVRGRIMFQDAWRKGLSWDEELSENDSAAWRLWFEDLFAVSKLQIPRCYNLSELDVVEVDLHLFSDSSESAFAAVAYWRFVYANGCVKLALICSKARVAPLKPVSILRLELQGALIAARLASSICEAHRMKPSRRVFWCDSMTVLGWLRSDARSFKPFVSHRVGEILENTNVKEWHWVPSHLNVADDATRAKCMALTPESRWILGPSFLLSSDWPAEPSIDISGLGREEIKPSIHHHVHLITDTDLPAPLAADPKRFSSWLRLVRATVMAQRFIATLRERRLQRRGINPCASSPWALNVSTSQLTTASDIRLAEAHILRQSQLDSFREDMLRIKSQEQLPRNSRLFHLSPFIDEQNQLRMSSRIVAVRDVSEHMKRPLILDGKHPAVRLLILRYHQKSAHQYNDMVMNELRQHFWILGLRNAVRSVSHDCQICKIRRATPFRPPMGDLPEARLSHHRRPFTFVGLDYFGPVQVSVGRRREKRYFALYTCLVVRAVHIEVVNSLSTDAAIMSLRRFIARRGTPAEIYSDNGTAFVGASRELRTLYADSVSEFAANERIKLIKL